MNWINLAQARSKWAGGCEMVMDFRVYKMRVISRLNEKVLDFQGGLR